MIPYSDTTSSIPTTLIPIGNNKPKPPRFPTTPRGHKYVRGIDPSLLSPYYSDTFAPSSMSPASDPLFLSSPSRSSCPSVRGNADPEIEMNVPAGEDGGLAVSGAGSRKDARRRRIQTQQQARAAGAAAAAQVLADGGASGGAGTRIRTSARQTRPKNRAAAVASGAGLLKGNFFTDADVEQGADGCLGCRKIVVDEWALQDEHDMNEAGLLDDPCIQDTTDSTKCLGCASSRSKRPCINVPGHMRQDALRVEALRRFAVATQTEIYADSELKSQVINAYFCLAHQFAYSFSGVSNQYKLAVAGEKDHHESLARLVGERRREFLAQAGQRPLGNDAASSIMLQTWRFISEPRLLASDPGGRALRNGYRLADRIFREAIDAYGARIGGWASTCGSLAKAVWDTHRQTVADILAVEDL